MGEGTNQMTNDRREEFDAVEREAIIDETAETPETAEIRVGIEQTRNDMSETIEAIQARLSPDHLKEQVKEQVREQFNEVKTTVRDATIGKAEEVARNVGESVNDARYTMMETISHNPIPAAMVALGLGWLWMNRRNASQRNYRAYENPSRYRVNQQYSEGQSYSGGAYGYATQPWYGNQQPEYRQSGMAEQGRQALGNAVERVQDTASSVANKAQNAVGNTVQGVQDTVSTIADKSQETVSHLVDQAQETAGNIAGQAQYQAQRLEDRFERTLRENPLAVGAVALALGTAVGFAIPETQREHELMGEARDNLVGKVQSVVQETAEKVQQVAGDVMEGAQETVQQSAKEQGLTQGS